MASPPGQSPYTVTESKVSNPLAEKQWAYLAKGPNAPLNILARDASWKAQMLEGMAKNDPKAQAKFFGHAPTAEDWARLKGGTGKPVPKIEKTAAQGGLMSLRGYAEGGKALTADQAAFVKKMAKKMQGKEALTDDERARLDKIEKVTGRDVSPYSDTGTKAPGDKSIKSAADAIRGEYNDPNPQNPASNNYGGGAGGTGATGGINPVDAITTPTFGFDPTLSREDYLADPYAGVTNPFYRQAIDQMGSMQKPEEYGQASGYYNTAAQGLQNLAGYKPQDVSAERASAQQASAERASAAQMAAIADVQASQMMKPEDVAAQRLERYQMGETAPVTTKDLTAYQMEGPGSWTDEGVSSKYMSPYMQGVIDISKREAERDYQKQVNALNAKAISAGAFGGSRQALERSEAQRNYNQQLQDMQVKGLQQAYESGRSQYGQELNLSQQAALNNLQSKLSTQSQSSQQQLQAMLSNQNIDYQTKLQNLQAMLGVQSQEAAQMLNASLANQQAALTTNQTNASLAQQAALANQQTQFGVGSLNANLANQVALQNASLGTQASLQNAQLGTQTSWQNAQNALQASMANQQAGLQGNAQNIGAYNAMGNMAQGLGALGNYTSAWDQQRLTNFGQMGNTWQSGMESAAEQARRNQFNATNPNIYLDPIFGAINRTPTAGNTSTTSNTYTP